LRIRARNLRALAARRRLSHRGERAPTCGNVFLLVLADDRCACTPRHHRCAPPWLLRLARMVHELLRESRHSDRSARALLALRRYRLGLSFSAHLSGGSTHMNAPQPTARTYLLNGVALLGFLGLTISTAYFNLAP